MYPATVSISGSPCGYPGALSNFGTRYPGYPDCQVFLAVDTLAVTRYTQRLYSILWVLGWMFRRAGALGICR